jgi:hypothetical protein
MTFKNYSTRNFIGRDNEVNAVVAAATAPLHTDAGSLYLAGSKGVGKSEILRRAYVRLFSEQKDVIPFFYTIKTAFTSIENFSKDFFGSFILQALSFVKEDPAVATASIYTMEDMREIAKRSGLDWCINFIDRFLRLKDDQDLMKMFSFAISAPERSSESGGLPVAVMIDDFHKIRKLCELNAEAGGSRLWLLFENLLKSRVTPHIITGYEPDLRKMFFEESSIGEDLEILYLRGLNPGDAVLLFETLCRSGGVGFEREVLPMIERFRGNPYYIRSFVQASRHAGLQITPGTFDDIYFNEVTRGKLFTYWVSALKHHIPHFEMRRPALRFLDCVMESGPEPDLPSLGERLALEREKLDALIDVLISSGAIDAGFSTLDIADDPVFRDVLKGLLLKELKSQGRDNLKKEIVGERPVARDEAPEEPAFIIGIPARKDAGMVAVRAVEHIANHYGIKGDLTGQLQMALVEALTILSGNNGSDPASYRLRLAKDNGIFIVEVTMRGGGDLREEVIHELKEVVGYYVDEVSIEDDNGIKRMMLRKSAAAPASED